MTISKLLLSISLVLPTALAFSQHNPGRDCISCHPMFSVGGTVFTDTLGKSVAPAVPILLTDPSGNTIRLSPSNTAGNFSSTTVPNGKYVINVGSAASRTWHELPVRRSCNVCHIVGGKYTAAATKRFPARHTALPSDNQCTNCHHFPVTMAMEQLSSSGVLSTVHAPDRPPGSYVIIGQDTALFDQSAYTIMTVRPDIFAPGYYSLFDVILAVAARRNIPVEYRWDDSCKTHFVSKIRNTAGNYWFHFSYDASNGSSRASGSRSELENHRANRWDEVLWRPGVWIKVDGDENVAELRSYYIKEILREKVWGHVVPVVNFNISPDSVYGNPPGSDRSRVNLTFTNITVTAHNLRSVGYQSPYSKPFQPGVVTSLDIPLSLMDVGKLNAVTAVFYSYFAGNYIDSYYLVELGFPGVGKVHSSGRQGIVYTTDNGEFRNGSIIKLPNQANQLHHITCDIDVIHAPDFSRWYWASLGNPYYESKDPTLTKVEEESIAEDYDEIPKGFNLHAPYPNPFNGSVGLSFNIFNPGNVTIEVYSVAGEQVDILVNNQHFDIGRHLLRWSPKNCASGVYFVVMKYGRSIQERRIVYLK